MNNVIKKIVSFIAISSISFSALSMNVSQSQIDAFKKLPEAQQRALAQQMGVDYNMIKEQLSGGGSSSSSSSETEPTPTYPRGTEFGSDGKPTIEPENKPTDFLKEDDRSLMQSVEPFGYDIFANQPSTFAPTNDIAIPENYILGPGDKISIQIFGKENNDYELPVTREGQVVIPNLGPYKVAGLSFTELKGYLTSRIKASIIGVDVVIGVASLRTMRVFVLGDAFKPGSYSLSSLSTITQAIFAAGGINEIGSLRNIQLKRQGKLVSTLDLYDLLINGDSSDDMQLQSGDVVFVESVGATVSIDGEVRRPAIYELIEGDTFADVLKMAGQLLPSAYAKSTLIERYNKSQLRRVATLDLTNDENLQLEVRAGDFIRIKKTADVYEETITVIGAATRPGKYQWYEGVKITDLIASVDSHLLPFADLSYSLVVREIDVAKNIEVHQFKLSEVIGNPASIDNFTLQPNDKIIVFSNVSKISEEAIHLDAFAFTQDELYEKERRLARVKYKNKLFWQQFGSENSKYGTAEEQDQQEQLELLNQSIAKFSGGEVEKEIDIRELGLFSRQRLLLPVIKKLKRQGSSGKPIQLVEIDGQVKYPGIYPLGINGKVDDLIAAAGGVDESAYLTRAEVTRNKMTEELGVEKISINVNLAKALSGDEEANIKLASKDRLNIHRIPSWTENHVVELRGEFVFPGKYTIRRGETLADIVKKAGGFTPYAYPNGSVFTRVKLQELEQQNLFKLAADLRTEMASKALSDSSATGNYQDAQQLLGDLTKVQPVGRLVIDLPKVMVPNNYDVLLEGGDVLYVPTKKNSVNVIGQVQVTSSHIYDSNIDAEDYIAQSGGMKKRADEERVYIISANGSIKVMDDSSWFSDGANQGLKPGDTIVVPLDGEYMNNLTLWSTATGILYNTAVAVAAINGI
ncbi:SLBB domain-containing protein [Thalassotalea nanhaiensis]|uniref:SLBB domain-containing protein n=1 Tax=Thalassotalea nanhaiensis TaxID=3065648 RepID=A0ABY9TLD9_9GAMM|nr:SLBB domain-containing protein [Colwelliaceae bacterium SQ345]